MDAPPAKPEPTITVAAEPTSDAYAAFWQCIDPDEVAPSSPPTSALPNAYEQFWAFVDAD